MALGQLGTLGGYRERRAAREQRNLLSISPQEERDILRTAMGGTVSGLSYLAGSLDKLGRPVRFAAQEGLERLGLAPQIDTDPREALAWIPFSDTLGITDRSHAVQGRDTVRYLTGEDPNNKSWLGFGAGLAYEIATDPLTYATLGAGSMSKFGKAFKKAGVLDDVVAKGQLAMRDSLGHIPTKGFVRRSLTPQAAFGLLTPEQQSKLPAGLLGALNATSPLQHRATLSAPFAGTIERMTGVRPELVFGKGVANQAGGMLSEVGLSRARAAVRDSKLGGALESMFRSKVRGATGSLARRGIEANASTMDNITKAAESDFFDLRANAAKFQETLPTDVQKNLSKAWLSVAEAPTPGSMYGPGLVDESLPVYDKFDDFLADHARLGDKSPLKGMTKEQVIQAKEIHNKYQAMAFSERAMRDRLQKLGYAGKDYNPILHEYAFRQSQIDEAADNPGVLAALKNAVSPGDVKGKSRGGSGFNVHSKSDYARNERLAYTPGGSATVSAVMGNPELVSSIREGQAFLKTGDALRSIRKSINKNETIGMETHHALKDIIARFPDGSGPWAPAKVAEYESRLMDAFQGGKVMRNDLKSLTDDMLKDTNKFLGPTYRKVRDAMGVDQGIHSAMLKRRKEIKEALENPELGETLGKAYRTELRTLEARLKSPKNLAHYIGEELTDKQLAGDFYGPYFDAAEKNVVSEARKLGTAETVQDMLAQFAERVVEGRGNLVQRGMRGADVGFKSISKVKGFRSKEKIFDDLADRLIQSGKYNVDKTALMKDLRTGLLKVPEDIANGIENILQATFHPPTKNALLQVVDSLTTAFKAGATSPWPAFHFRNDYSGMAFNTVAGSHDPRMKTPIMRFWKPYQDSNGLLLGKDIEGLDAAPIYKGMTNDEANKAFRKALFTEGVNPSIERELGGDALDIFKHTDFVHKGKGRSVGSEFIKLGKAWANVPLPRKLKFLDEGGNPLKLLGKESQGYALAATIEARNRIAGVLGLVRQGWDVGAAVKQIERFQADYSPKAFSQFEQGVMKRVFPFYAFQRQVAQGLAQELMERPGGGFGKWIRARDEAASDEPLPVYARGGTVVDVPGQSADEITVLGALGLPEEVLGDLIRPGNSLQQTITGSVGGLIANTNPVIKETAQHLLDRNFFADKSMAETVPTTLRVFQHITGQKENPATATPLAQGLRLAESAANVVGAGRFLNSLGQLTDAKTPLTPGGRKAWWQSAANLTTGLRFTTDSKEEFLKRGARNLMEDYLRGTKGARTFERLYIPKESLQNLSPEQQKAWALFSKLGSR